MIINWYLTEIAKLVIRSTMYIKKSPGWRPVDNNDQTRPIKHT